LCLFPSEKSTHRNVFFFLAWSDTQGAELSRLSRSLSLFVTRPVSHLGVGHGCGIASFSSSMKKHSQKYIFLPSLVRHAGRRVITFFSRCLSLIVYHDLPGQSPGRGPRPSRSVTWTWDCVFTYFGKALAGMYFSFWPGQTRRAQGYHVYHAV
jgi:hypothetical protein